MKNYDVYFEIFGKKMKKVVLAETMTEAKQKVIDEIKWHKVTEKTDDYFNKSMDLLDDLSNIMGIKTNLNK